MNPEAPSIIAKNTEVQRLTVSCSNQKYTCPNSNCQELISSTSDRIILELNKEIPVCTQNRIAAPSINNKHKTNISQKCNSLIQNYVDITGNMWTSERNADLLVNSNMTPITLPMRFHYQYYY